MPVSRTLKKIVLALLIGAAVLTPTVSFAAECGISEFTACVEKAFNWIIMQIGNLLSALSGWLISIAAAFIEVLLKISSKVTTNPLVQEGFKITLGIANLGFVLAIIVTAYATILRWEKYAFKQILGKLIIAALLVNFSFAIAGIVIDFTNVLGSMFLGPATSENIKAITVGLAKSLDAQKLAAISPEVTQGVISVFANSFVQLAAIVLFNGFLVITFFALAFMLLVRYVYLIILLIFMPLAWLMMIFPDLNQHWKKWWDKFIQWNFFYPAVSFFIYLAITTQKKMQALTMTTGVSKIEPAQAAAIIMGIDVGSIGIFIQIFVQVGIILGGLMAAQSMSITGAATAMSFAQKLKGGVLGAYKGAGKWAAGTGAWLGTAPLRWQRAQNALQKMGQVGKNRGFLLRTITAPLRAAAGGLGTVAQTFAEKPSLMGSVMEGLRKGAGFQSRKQKQKVSKVKSQLESMENQLKLLRQQPPTPALQQQISDLENKILLTQQYLLQLQQQK